MSNTYRSRETPPPKKKRRTTLLIIIIVGAVILLTIIVIVVILLLRRKNNTLTPAAKCRYNTDCPPNFQCNTSTGNCAECFSSSDCAGHATRKICNTNNGTCVECSTNGDCTNANAPYCLSSKCVRCINSTQCPQGQICNLSNQCM